MPRSVSSEPCSPFLEVVDGKAAVYVAAASGFFTKELPDMIK